MIKSVVEKKEENYPLIKVSIKGNIVLFSGLKTGVVLSAKDPSYKVGEHLTGWAEEGFKFFNGTITLSNERR